MSYRNILSENLFSSVTLALILTEKTHVEAKISSSKMLNISLRKYSLKKSRFAELSENDNCYENKATPQNCTQIDAITQQFHQAVHTIRGC